jgi:hypothetical protein
MKKAVYFFLSMVLFSSLTSTVLAVGNLDNAIGNLRRVGGIAGTGEEEVGTVVGRIIYAALTLIGTIFFVLMVYAGYLWMTARGAEEQVEKAKNIIRAAIIGLVVVVSAYAITVFVTRSF